MVNGKWLMMAVGNTKETNTQPDTLSAPAIDTPVVVNAKRRSKEHTCPPANTAIHLTAVKSSLRLWLQRAVNKRWKAALLSKAVAWCTKGIHICLECTWLIGKMVSYWLRWKINTFTLNNSFESVHRKVLKIEKGTAAIRNRVMWKNEAFRRFQQTTMTSGCCAVSGSDRAAATYQDMC